MKIIFKKSILAAVLTAGTAFSSQAYATNIVVNGSFEQGNTGFSSGYTVGNHSSTSLYPEAMYEIGNNPHNYHPAFASISAQDGTQMMVVNGAPQTGVNVWRESGLAIASNTTYFFSTWISSVTPDSPADLQFSINGINIGSLQASSSTAWQQFYTTWNSGAATTATIALVNMNTSAGGNDFALDNIAFDTIAPASSAVPEPTSLALLGLGLASAGIVRRRKKQV